MNTKDLLETLKQTTKEAEENKRLKRKEEAENQTKMEENSLKEKAEEVFNELMKKERLIAFAKTGNCQYPLLLIKESECGYNKPVCNKKTGYRYAIGKLGEFLFDKLTNEGFEPVLIRVDSWELEDHKHTNPNRARCYDKKVVSKSGWYLGISW